MEALNTRTSAMRKEWANKKWLTNKYFNEEIQSGIDSCFKEHYFLHFYTYPNLVQA
jgi:hypothetical protein